MVQKIALMVLGVIALLGVALMTVQIKSLTGEYVAGSNVGSWYAGEQIAQLPPDQACVFAGHPPSASPSVLADERFGTLLSKCGDGALVPLVQTIIVPGPKDPPIFIG